MKLFYWILGIIIVALGIGALIRYSPRMQNNIGEVIPSDIPKNNYVNKTLGVSVFVPPGYKTDESYKYQMAPRQSISGVKFTIPPEIAEGTNLAKDSYVSVEKLSSQANCSADRFLDGSHSATAQTINGVNYSVANAQNAGAGNRYEETVYAIQGNTCIGIRYVVHYRAIQNYPQGSVQEFNKEAIIKNFDIIRDSVVVQ